MRTGVEQEEAAAAAKEEEVVRFPATIAFLAERVVPISFLCARVLDLCRVCSAYVCCVRRVVLPSTMHTRAYLRIG